MRLEEAIKKILEENDKLVEGMLVETFHTTHYSQYNKIWSALVAYLPNDKVMSLFKKLLHDTDKREKRKLTIPTGVNSSEYFRGKTVKFYDVDANDRTYGLEFALYFIEKLKEATTWSIGLELLLDIYMLAFIGVLPDSEIQLDLVFQHLMRLMNRRRLLGLAKNISRYSIRTRSIVQKREIFETIYDILVDPKAETRDKNLASEFLGTESWIARGMQNISHPDIFRRPHFIHLIIKAKCLRTYSAYERSKEEFKEKIPYVLKNASDSVLSRLSNFGIGVTKGICARAMFLQLLVGGATLPRHAKSKLQMLPVDLLRELSDFIDFNGYTELNLFL